MTKFPLIKINFNSVFKCVISIWFIVVKIVIISLHFKLTEINNFYSENFSHC